MIKYSGTQARNSATPAVIPGRDLLLQRQCACGGSAGLTGDCSDCQSKKLLGKPLQTKLRINEPGDEYEREADRVAQQVVGMGESRPSSADPHRSAELLLRRGDAARAMGAAQAPATVRDVLSSSGAPLDRSTRGFFEKRLGHDFRSVRIHADASAARSARSVHATAYTVGQDVVFGAGQYAPGTTAGQKLLAHELVHVVQQREGSPAMSGDGGDYRGSTAATTAANAGKPATVHPAGGAFIQRQTEPEPPVFPDLPGLIVALEDDVGENLFDYGHHLYQASLLHPDEPQYLENALARYALGLNVLKTSYLFAGLDPGAADKLALGTGILFKGLSFVREGEFTLDYQIDIGKGLKLETNIDLNVNPDDYTDVQNAGVNIGVVGHF